MQTSKTQIKTKCEYLKNPVGIQTQTPRFFWTIESEKPLPPQKAYQIIVTEIAAKKTVWDSGLVLSSNSSCIVYEGDELKEKTAYKWSLRIVLEDGTEYIKDDSTFETAIFNPSSWVGEWISANNPVYGISPRFRRTFTIDNNIGNARLYIAGLGYFVAYLNGRRISEDVLNPGMTDYRKRVLYSVYDVTEYLVAGENVLAVELGEGWYGHQHECMIKFMGKQPAWNSFPKLLYQLEIQHDDGNTTVASSSKFDRFSEGPIIENGIYDGETFDARREIKGWNTADFDDSGWSLASKCDPPAGKLQVQLMPIRVTETIIPRLIYIGEESEIWDLGQNIAGWVSITCKGNCGDTLRIKYAELLEGNHVNQLNLRQARATDTYICCGEGKEEYEPKFTYHGFRYVEIERAEHVEILSVVGKVVHNPVDYSGKFYCSNELINKIQNAYVWTERNNMHSIPTDCPQRDERLAWLNDIAVRCYPVMYNFDLALFFEKWLDDIVDAQSDEGAIPDTAPFVYGGLPAVHVTSSFIIIPWLLYQFYNDATVIKRLYPSMKKYVLYKAGLRDENGLFSTRFYGDWATPAAECIDDGAWNATPKNIPNNIITLGYLIHDCELLARMADIAGFPEDKPVFAGICEEATRDLNRHFLHDEGFYGTGLQGSQIMPLYIDIVPEEMRMKVLAALLKDLEEKEFHITTGNQTTKLLFDVLSRENLNNIAFKVATVKGYPGFDYMFENGATTIWERWENLTGDGMNSHNHPMLAAFTDWFYREIGGIRHCPGIAGDTGTIRPDYLIPLKFASCSYSGVKGEISVNWEKKDNLELDISVPWNMKAMLQLKTFAVECGEWKPTDSLVTVILESGKHHISFDGSRIVSENC